MRIANSCLEALLELIYPEHCARCGSRRCETQWCRPGAVVPGLRRWDQPHLCRPCFEALCGAPVTTVRCDDRGEEIPVAAALATSAELVALIGAWKYHSVRGLAWPLAHLLEPVAKRISPGLDPVLVPVPLHPRRHRSRGFNQSELLARLLAHHLSWEVSVDRLRRARATGQQARLGADDLRRANLAGAFQACEARAGDRRDCLVVDDVVTSGATLLAATGALRAGGWHVVGALAVGVALGDRS